MQVTLTIPDRKADSFLDVIRHISYVEIQPFDVPDHQPAADEDEDEEEFSEEEFYEGLKEAIHDVKEHIAGRKQLKTLDEFLDEFQGRAHC